MLYRALYPSPCGDILLESDGENLTGLSFLGGEGADPARLRAGTAVPVLAAACFWLDRYFQGEAPAADLPLKVSGTPFQGQVWAILREIPYGETLSYGEVAAVIGEKRGGKTGLLARQRNKTMSARSRRSGIRGLKKGRKHGFSGTGQGAPQRPQIQR